MSSVNKVTLLGRVGADAEIKAMSNGGLVAKFSLATTDSWVDRNGHKQEKTEWHRILIFGKSAEKLGKHIQKGRLLYIEGKLQTRSWDENGQKRYTTEIILLKLTFLPSGNGGQKKQNDENVQDNQMEEEASFGPEPGFDESDEIPF